MVGHLMGRCIDEISILADRERGYKGYCSFDEFAEHWQGLLQWRASTPNPERITIQYAGTAAMKIVCQQRGWNYDHWWGCDVGDLATIYLLWSVEIAGEKEAKQHALQRACLSHAQDILESYWGAVEVLAAVLAKKVQMWGAKAHRIIKQAIDPTYSD